MKHGTFKKVLSGVVVGGLVMTLGLGCKKKEKTEEPPAGTEQSVPTTPEETPSEPQAPYGTEAPSAPSAEPSEPTTPPADETTQAPMP
jgi:hypothetical protein